jgi:bifunctional DNA-binding transcriptional regulator/antitoxin component of YhaV-PrlF toxin-antitoxin module
VRQPVPPPTLESHSLGLAEQFELVVEVSGSVVLPQEVREALSLEPGDFFSIVRNPVSLRLDSFRVFLADNWDAVSPPNRWRYIEEFLRRPLTALEQDRSIKIPPEDFPLSVGDSIVLEVVHRGLSYELFLYRAEGPPAHP